MFSGCCKWGRGWHCFIAEKAVTMVKEHHLTTTHSDFPYPCPWPPFVPSCATREPTAEKRVNLGLVVLGNIFSRRMHICVPCRHFMFLIYCFVHILVIDLFGDLRPISYFSLKWFLKICLIWVKWQPFPWSCDLNFMLFV